jgi:K+-transporting ATPase A subunit
MTLNSLLQLLLYLVVLIALAKPLGGYMARVYTGPWGQQCCCAITCSSMVWVASSSRSSGLN